jgi:excinuclease UvrABC nuclease subunit
MIKAHLAWLATEQFKHTGLWSSGAKKLHRSDPIEPVAGIYAFVVDGTIVYIGKATRLRSRVRAYNRSLAPETNKRPFRRAHLGIREMLDRIKQVDVWVFDHALHNGSETIEELEAK